MQYSFKCYAIIYKSVSLYITMRGASLPSKVLSKVLHA